eukprot:m.291470 g.291470  ORF g.291470 m.291470 type:complete len:84 (-) comp12473_c0_seq1:24-275(-)
MSAFACGSLFTATTTKATITPTSRIECSSLAVSAFSRRIPIAPSLVTPIRVIFFIPLSLAALPSLRYVCSRFVVPVSKTLLGK